MREEIKAAVDAMGDLAEILRAFYRALTKKGFTKGEALVLTEDYLTTVIRPETGRKEMPDELAKPCKGNPRILH